MRTESDSAQAIAQALWKNVSVFFWSSRHDIALKDVGGYELGHCHLVDW